MKSKALWYLGFSALAALLVWGCSGSGGGGTSSGSGSGNGTKIELTATSASMKVSSSTSNSTQTVIANVTGSDGTQIADGTSVTFTVDMGGFLGSDNTTQTGTITVSTSNGKATAVYAAPTSKGSARIGASANGAYAWVQVSVY